GLIAFVVALGVRSARGGGGLRAVPADPAITVVLASFIALAIYSLRDFQGYPDLYPGLPYSALGAGGAPALLVAGMRRGVARRPLPRQARRHRARLRATARARRRRRGRGPERVTSQSGRGGRRGYGRPRAGQYGFPPRGTPYRWRQPASR